MASLTHGRISEAEHARHASLGAALETFALEHGLPACAAGLLPAHVVLFLASKAAVCGRVPRSCIVRYISSVLEPSQPLPAGAPPLPHWMAHSSLAKDASGVAQFLAPSCGFAPWNAEWSRGNPALSTEVTQFLEGYRKFRHGAGHVSMPALEVGASEVASVVSLLHGRIRAAATSPLARVAAAQLLVATLFGSTLGDRAATVVQRRWELLFQLGPPAAVGGAVPFALLDVQQKSALLSPAAPPLMVSRFCSRESAPALCLPRALRSLMDAYISLGLSPAVAGSGVMFKALRYGRLEDSVAALSADALESRFRSVTRELGLDLTFGGLRRGATQAVAEAVGDDRSAVQRFGHWQTEHMQDLYLFRVGDLPGAGDVASFLPALASAPLGSSSAATAPAAGSSSSAAARFYAASYAAALRPPA